MWRLLPLAAIAIRTAGLRTHLPKAAALSRARSGSAEQGQQAHLAADTGHRRERIRDFAHKHAPVQLALIGIMPVILVKLMWPRVVIGDGLIHGGGGGRRPSKRRRRTLWAWPG